MASIYARGRRLWARVKKNGKWIGVKTPFEVGDERKAEEFAAEGQAILDGKAREGAEAGLAVDTYAARWIIKRRERDLDWQHDETRLRLHVLPVIGHILLANVRTRDLVDLFHRIRTGPRVVAPRTVYNIYSVVSAMFRDAKFDDLIAQSPCELDERQLGPLADKDPEWRQDAVYTRDEVERLISDERIPPDRQMLYGLDFLAGVRHGEAAALRWRHYDPTLEPLGKLLVAVAYSSAKHAVKSTKTGAVRHVPVHPALASMLAEWRLSGWPAMMGRAPGPDDLIVPLPPADAARRIRGGEPHRDKDYSGKRFRAIDLPALGLRHRRMHDSRATFITLALDDGADPHVIETRVTHTRKSRSAFTGYNRGRQWDVVCAEVAKLRISRKPRGRVVRLATVLATDDEDGNDSNSGASPARGERGGAMAVSDRLGALTAQKVEAEMVGSIENVRNLLRAISEASAREDVGLVLSLADTLRSLSPLPAKVAR